MKKLITFSLWGENPKYCVGAIRNAQLAKTLYPGWTCRFYVPSQFSMKETQPGLFIGGELAKTVDALLGMDNVEVIDVDEPSDWRGMFWRFHPASQDDVDVFISRDCDSRLSRREALAVEEWMKSTKLVHSMADHPYHFNPRLGLMGGMFGMKKHACPQMSGMIKEFAKQFDDAWQCDQDFLKEYVYPLVAHKIFPTSDIHPHCMPFPISRDGDNFVGSIIGPNEEKLHPEHHAMVK